MPRYDFPSGTPWPMKVIPLGMIVNFVGFFACDLWAERYAPRQPTIAYTTPMRFKGGVVAFVPSWLAHYVQWGFLSHFVLLGIIFLLLWWYVRNGAAVRVR